MCIRDRGNSASVYAFTRSGGALVMTAMRPEEWRRVRDLFDRSVALPAGERTQFVADACLADEGLHRQVSALLHAHEHAHDFLETACVTTVAAWPNEDLTGTQFGPFLLESRIGGGGMGEVYLSLIHI